MTRVKVDAPLALLLQSFTVLCLLSKMASDTAGGAGGLSDCITSSARGLIRRADVSLEEARQDGLAAVGLGHAIEARVYAQAAKAVLQSCGRNDPELLAKALDIESAAQEAEDALLGSLADDA